MILSLQDPTGKVRVVAQKRGKSLRHRAKEKEAYRVEAYRRYLLRRRGWVFTNPIYVI